MLPDQSSVRLIDFKAVKAQKIEIRAAEVIISVWKRKAVRIAPNSWLPVYFLI